MYVLVPYAYFAPPPIEWGLHSWICALVVLRKHVCLNDVCGHWEVQSLLQERVVEWGCCRLLHHVLQWCRVEPAHEILGRTCREGTKVSGINKRSAKV